MDKDTIIASLKNDIGKLEKHLQGLNSDIVVQHQKIRTAELDLRAYKKESEREYKQLKETFVELLDKYFQLKKDAIGISNKEIKEELYKWMEKSGLL
jgi:predicted  nucleic acid-binding Zn-ribbon protein